MARVKAPVSGVATVYAFDDHPVLLAASPATRPPDGLFVVVGVDPPDLLAGIGTGVIRAAVLGGLATLAALVITYLAARRFIQRPAGRLLAAAQRWRRGELATRAEMQASLEFGRLGEAFNQMASDIETREAEPRSRRRRGGAGRGAHPRAVGQQQPPAGRDRGARAHRGGLLQAQKSGGRPARGRRGARFQQPARHDPRQPRVDRCAIAGPRTSDCGRCSARVVPCNAARSSTARLLAFSRRKRLRRPRRPTSIELVTDLVTARPAPSADGSASRPEWPPISGRPWPTPARWRRRSSTLR